MFTCLFSPLPFTAVKVEAADRQAVTFKEVKASDDHVGALDTEGNLWMWGHNGNGQIGNGTMEDALTPQLGL